MARRDASVGVVNGVGEEEQQKIFPAATHATHINRRSITFIHDGAWNGGSKSDPDPDLTV
ncbi:hypothetical protein F1880_002800 [Penicillium rolfsii]|nr:hypothetical protein F1880_002800 [Penicillium rolfsii]